MSYFDVYKSRLKAYGNSSDEVTINTSKYIVNKSFDDSLFSTVISIDGVNIDVIVNQGNVSDEKTVLLRPDKVVNKGAIAIIEGLNYLIIDFDTNKVYPIAKAKLCNSTFPIKTNKTLVQKTDQNGNPVYDRFGDPVYIEVGGELVNEPCIVETTFLSRDQNTQLPLPEGRIHITLKYQKADCLKINYEFNMYNSRYKIYDIDYTKTISETGLMTIIANKVVKE